MHPPNLKSQKGSGLLQAMLAVFLSSVVVGGISQMNTQRRKEQKIETLKIKRDEIASRLASNLVNRDMIQASTDISISHPGNQLLRKCLGADYQTNSTPIPTDTASANCIPNQETPFLLAPTPGFYFGAPGPNKNCPNPSQSYDSQDVSCFLATPPEKLMGYNFDGETGSYGPAFPLKATAYFRPVCVDESSPAGTDPNAPCVVAKSIQVRYQIDHDQKFSEPVSLGKYPLEPNWMNLHISQVTGQECNQGAIVVAIDQQSKIRCMCHFPYKTREISSGVPAENAKGPLCDLEESSCPPGLVLTGRDTDGKPVCSAINQNTRVFVKETDTRDPLGASCQTDNNNNIVSGWASKVKVSCEANLGFSEDQSNDYDPRAVAYGAVAGAVAAAAITTAIAVTAATTFTVVSLGVATATAISTGVALSTLGVAMATAAGPMVAISGALSAGVITAVLIPLVLLLGTLGAVLGWYFSQQEAYRLKPNSGYTCAQGSVGDIACPEVTCHYEIECTAFE